MSTRQLVCVCVLWIAIAVACTSEVRPDAPPDTGATDTMIDTGTAEQDEYTVDTQTADLAPADTLQPPDSQLQDTADTAVDIPEVDQPPDTQTADQQPADAETVDTLTPDSAADTVDVPPDTGVVDCATCDWGTALGSYQITYYWLAMEADYSEPEDTPIYDQDGNVIKYVPKAFACALAVEGSGKLTDGRVVNYWGGASSCVNYTVCQEPYYPSSVCYSVLDETVYPWGKGVKRRALTPFRSLAVDPDHIPYGTIIFLPDFCGYQLPDGPVSSGCFRADDTGGAIIGEHIDFFSGTRENYKIIDGDMPSYVDLYIDPPCCAWLAAHYEAVGAACSAAGDCGYEEAYCELASAFAEGYCTESYCEGGDCPDVGGYYSFCGATEHGPMCVRKCQSSSDCRQGYSCQQLDNLISSSTQTDGCVPQ